MRALHNPAPRHEAAELRRAGLAWVAGDVGDEAQGLDPGAESPVVEGAVGRGHAGRGALGDMQAGQGDARGWQVVAIAALYGEREDKPRPIDDGRPLRALLAPVEPGGPPFSVRESGAFTWQPSTARNDQSTVPAACAISRQRSCNRSNAPACFHSRKRRSAVAEEQRLVALSARQGQPVRITNQIASMARRAGTGGRPPLGCGGGVGSNGSITAHSPSGSRHVSIAKPSDQRHPLSTHERF